MTKYDLYPILIEELKKLYGLPNETENYLYKYIFVRTSVFHDKRKVSNREVFNFILDELNIETFRDEDSSTLEYLTFKNEKYNVFEVNSEFIDNLVFRAEMEADISIYEELEEIFRKGYQKAYKYRKEHDYKERRKYNRLLVLNEFFGADPTHSPGVEGFHTSPNHNPMKRSLEEELELLLASNEKGVSSATTYITEEMLEDYLVENIELIEPGLVFFKRQVSITGGFIDILAKDANDKMCVIEIKINEDKSIIWQAIHYSGEIKRKYNTKVRMITVAPKYSKPIYDALKSIPEVETFNYDVEVSDGEIVNLKLNEV